MRSRRAGDAGSAARGAVFAQFVEHRLVEERPILFPLRDHVLQVGLGLGPATKESLEVLFTAHCGETEPQVISAFVVDLFAEASRNRRVAGLVRDVCETTMAGVTDLIARSPEVKGTNLTPREMAELIFAVNDGMLMRDVLKIGSAFEERRGQQLKVARNLWRLLFKEQTEPAYA